MRKLLTCTTALSLALSHAPVFPAYAQTLAEDGSVLGDDGSVLCVPTAELACDLEAITLSVQEAAAAEAARLAAEAEAVTLAAEEEAARVAAEEAARLADEAEAAQMAADEAAALATAEAEAAAAAAAEAAQLAAEDAAAVAAAEEAARVAAEEQAAQLAAEEEAARAAAEAAATAAASDEAARLAAETEAATAAAAEAARIAAEEEAARVAAEDATRLAAEEAAAKAVEDQAGSAPVSEPAPEVVEPEVVEEVAPEVAEDVAPEVVEEVAPEVVEEAAPEVVEDVAPEVVEEVAPEVVEESAPEVIEEVAPEDTAEAPSEEGVDPTEALVVEEPVVVAEPVDVPEVSEEAASVLDSILGGPTVTEESAVVVPEEGAAPTGDDVAEAPAEGTQPAVTVEPTMPVAATATLSTSDTDATGEAAPAPEPVAVATEVISEENTRTSDQEFAAAPVAVSGGKKSGLSDLEKVGLLALGALVVGAIINEGKKDERKVVSNSGDRVVVENPDGSYVVYKDDDAILRRPGVQTQTETYRDGSTRTIVSRADGTQVVTIRDASGRVLRRATYDVDGREVILFDDLYPEERIDITTLPLPDPGRVTISSSDSDVALRAELAALEAEQLGRKFSLRQIREIAQVRALAATIEVDTITFDSGSAAIKATEARKLADIGRMIQELLAAKPNEVFLIEGHTDAVGSAASNLSLSDRRAESLALALTEYFDIPPENLVVQGYGEGELKVESLADERANRRVVVRLITPLMRTAELR
jgi:outer membrane protein OmpA-like peptidoglycan-associated protein